MPESFNAFLQKKIEAKTILILEEDVLAGIPPKDHVIQGTRIMKSGFSWHDDNLPYSFILSGLTRFPHLPALWHDRHDEQSRPRS